ncbi:hypothetical protein GCM10008927_14240 [Amylibacter ulvae]|uniref:Uncharacterized protein n=1 Tax=Paramylibacter ulvae TaxID=1651968 RepID=A0ABQ3D0L0_9RHOB|nr:hypothetical protein [Amylibacter ulvae]GHA50363.1 hypothetical protein GCM10008927_14240 [Amylibacter ulvae]
MKVALANIRLQPGPIGIIFAEDDIGLVDTVAHLRKVGFANIFVVGTLLSTRRLEPADDIHVFDHDPDRTNAVSTFLNLVIKAFPNQWIFHCFNGEFIYFPFCETRSIIDLLCFADEENRISMAGTIVDLYTEENTPKTCGYDDENWLFDKSGYFANYRDDQDQTPMRYVETYGGLRWRLEEFFPPHRRRIDRTNLFKAVTGLQLDENLDGNLPEFGTIGAPWHNSPTIVIASFRATKFLHLNTHDKRMFQKLSWSCSAPFEKSSHQLMELGFMEPGQWF